MLNFSRRDRIAQAKNVDKGALKPALYDPPGNANRSTAANVTATRPSSLVPAAQSPQPHSRRRPGPGRQGRRRPSRRPHPRPSSNPHAASLPWASTSS